MVDALSRLLNHSKLVGVHNQNIHAHLFTLQHEWLRNVFEYLSKGVMLERYTTSQRQYLAQKVKPFIFEDGVFYQFGQVNRFYCVLQQGLPTILQELHIRVAKRHFSLDIIVMKILDVGY